MLVGSCLLIIILLSFGSPLIPASPNPSHDAVKLNIFQTGCGRHHRDRQSLSIATFNPIRYLPGSKNSLPCTALSPAVVGCNMTVVHSNPLIIAVEIRAKNCTKWAPHLKVKPINLTPINATHTNDTHTVPIGLPLSEGPLPSLLRRKPINETHTRQADEKHISAFPIPSLGPSNGTHTNLRKPISIIPPTVPFVPSPVKEDHHYYIEIKMHIDSTFTFVPGSLSHEKHDLSLLKQLQVKPPNTGNAIDFASSISPSAALANCAAGFMFGTGTILERKTPIPSECIDLHTGVKGFKNHVVIGHGYSDYMTDAEIQRLPAPDSRALIQSARNQLVFTNNMYTALADAFTDAQLLVNDMRYDLIPEPRPPKIHVNLGDILIIIGVLLPALPVGAAAPALIVLGGSMVIYGTLLNERPELAESYNIVSDDRLQTMKDRTQESFYHLMNSTFFTNHNYTVVDEFHSALVQGLPAIEAPIKQQAVAWAGSQFLNYYGFKVCDNPDDYSDCGCHHDNAQVSQCNDKIQGLDCRFAGGLSNNGGGYFYSIGDDGTPTGDIADFTKYFANGNFTDLCNNQNGWNVTRGRCARDDYPSGEDKCNCHEKGLTIVISKHCTKISWT